MAIQPREVGKTATQFRACAFEVLIAESGFLWRLGGL
jgi:hypothetical protein